MEQRNEATPASTYRPRTGSMERRKTAASAATEKAAQPADEGEERAPRVRREPGADEAPAKRAPARQSFFKNRTPQAEPREEREEREEYFGEKPKRAPRKPYGDEGARPARRPYAGDRERPAAPRRKYGEGRDKPWGDRGEDKPKRSGGFDAFRREKPRTERRSSAFRDERPERPFARKPYGDDKPRRAYGEAAPYERKPYGSEGKPRRAYRDGDTPPPPYERKPYGKKAFGESPYADSKRPRSRPYEDKPRKDIRVLERKPRAVAVDPTAPVRLNKFIANSGVCSRREADEYIERGEVTVNGAVVTELGTKVLPTDDICWHGEKLSGEKKVYLLLNKPKGYVTTVEDPHAERTVMELIAGACPERVYPVGRLDRNSTGVLLFTNDGELTKQLTHPGYNKRKVYQVSLDKTLKKPDMERLVAGVELEDGVAVADEVGYVDLEDKAEVGIELHSGRNRVVRRMFEALGYEVKKLDRVYFAGLTKKSLERGKWRMLSPKEVSMLKMGAYE